MTKVMIIDDDRTTVKLLQTLLELDNFEVFVAGRGADAMPLALKVRPDVFLMDYHLSDMHGVEILRALRASEEFATTPVVVASGMDVSAEVMDAGANHFLIKPFEPDDLSVLFNKLTGN